MDREYAAFSSPAQVAAIDRFLQEHGIAEIVDLRSLLTYPAVFDDPNHITQQRVAPLLHALEKHASIR